jgi:MFS family permease
MHEQGHTLGQKPRDGIHMMGKNGELASRPSKMTIAIFALCFILAQADKQLMGVISLPLKEHLALTNGQLGLLQGASFALAFAIGGIPISQLVDRGNRVRIAAICVIAWSVTTIFCGFAQSFALLFLLRAMTAVAEAGLAPAFFSMLSQGEDRKLVARSTALFMLGPFVGGGLVLLVGGQIIRADRHIDVAGFATLAPWQTVFVLLGVLGLVVGPLLLKFGHEPQRKRQLAGANTDRPSMRRVMSIVFVESPQVRNYYLGILFVCMLIYALIAWYPYFLAAEYRITPGDAGRYAGIAFLVMGTVGTLVTGYVAGRLPRITPSFIIRAFCVAALLLMPICLGITLGPSLGGSIALYGLYALLSAGILSIMALPLQLLIDNDMMGRAVAIFSFLGSAIGGSLGPLAVGLLMDWGNLPVRVALACVCVSAGALAVYFLVLAVRVAGARDAPILAKASFDNAL